MSDDRRGRDGSPLDVLAISFMLPPQFEHQRAEILGALEPLVT